MRSSRITRYECHWTDPKTVTRYLRQSAPQDTTVEEEVEVSIISLDKAVVTLKTNLSKTELLKTGKCLVELTDIKCIPEEKREEREVIAYTLIQDTGNLNDKDSNPWGYYGQAALQKSSSNAISINLTIHWPTLNQTPRKQTNIDVNSAVVSLPLPG